MLKTITSSDSKKLNGCLSDVPIKHCTIPPDAQTQAAIGIKERRIIIFLFDMASIAMILALFQIPPLLGFIWILFSTVTLYAENQYSLCKHSFVSIAFATASGITATTLSSFFLDFSSFLLFKLVSCALISGFLLFATRNFLYRFFTDRIISQKILFLCDNPILKQNLLADISKYPLAGITPIFSSSLNTGQLFNDFTSKANLIAADHSTLAKGRSILASSIRMVGIPEFISTLSYQIPIRHIDERWLIEHVLNRHSIVYSFLKRLMDLSLSIMGLIILSPVIIAVAIAVLADSGWPILYSQQRCGLKGTIFRIYKFRTMRQNAEKDGAVWAKEQDSRITRVGRFLRSTRLDEIPQLFNVFIGQMSIVGPRPERPEFVSKLAEAIPYYDSRHEVLPGITGWAQVSFPYGASVEDSEQKLKFDLYYLMQRSLILDIKVILRTISVVLNRRGAR